jgi:very-short-patch-repair endonuclease
VCFEKKLVIEIDGGQHNEPLNKRRDEERTRVLTDKHYKVIRYWDNDVLQNTDGVLENIRQTITQRSHPHLTSPVKGEE